jgi:hypothetical protein
MPPALRAPFSALRTVLWPRPPLAEDAPVPVARRAILVGESLAVEDVDVLHLILPSPSPRLWPLSPAPAYDGSRRG